MKTVWLKSQQGVSIIIAIGFSGLVLLVALGLNTVILPSLLGSGNVEIGTQAHYAAEGAVEDALYELGKHEAGFEVQSRDFSVFSSINQTETRFLIRSRAVPSEGEFVIPAPTEGDSPTDTNWNKIAFGESLTIPLYFDEAIAGVVTSDNDIQNPVDIGLNRLQLKLRLPAPHIAFDTAESEQFGISDDTLLSWSFSALERDGIAKYTLQEMVEYDSALPPNRQTNESTELYESKIENAPDNIVLDTAVGSGVSQFQSIGMGRNQDNLPQEILDFLLNTPAIHKPRLKLTSISSLESAAGESIPYLEYQVVADTAIPDVYTTIVAEGIAQGLKQSIQIRVKNITTAPLFDFAISQ